MKEKDLLNSKIDLKEKKKSKRCDSVITLKVMYICIGMRIVI
jgi:hypothetical protein